MIDTYSDPAAALLAAGDIATPSDPAVARLWDLAVRDAWDPHDPHAAAVLALCDLADLLIGWESPEWGSVDGRYGYGPGARSLTGTDWAALEDGAYQDDERLIDLQPVHDLLEADPGSLPTVVHLGDLLSTIATLTAH